jgi:hypothetical protein
MPVNYITSLSIKALKPIKPADNTITVSRSDAAKLNAVGVGNYTDLTLRLIGQNDVSEVVRYNHTQDITGTGTSMVDVIVMRDVHNTGRRSFSVFTCARAELSQQDILDIVCNAPCVVSLSTALSTAQSTIASLSTIVGAP